MSVFISGIALLLISGCNPDYEGGRSKAEVAGSVFLDDRPVDNAQVVFVPLKATGQGGSVAPFAYGTTDAEGNFELTSANGKPGAVVGRHIVLISKKRENAIPQKNDLEIASVANNFLEETGIKGRYLHKRGFSSQPKDELIPAIYNKMSILECDVDSTLGKVRPRFNLTTIDPELAPPTKKLIDHQSSTYTSER